MFLTCFEFEPILWSTLVPDYWDRLLSQGGESLFPPHWMPQRFLPFPIKRGEVAIIVSTRVVPIDAKCVKVALRSLRQSQSVIGGMKRVVDI